MQAKQAVPISENQTLEVRYAYDEQKGEYFAITSENRLDRIAAIISVIYLMIMVVALFWLLFDTWIGQYSLARVLGYTNRTLLETLTFRHFAYTMIGGALGGVVNGIRSFLVWHSDRASFSQRYVWKFLSLPWLGATLALFVYSLFLGGVVSFAGEISQDNVTVTQSLLAFAIGGLAGYGSNKVMIWLTSQVDRLFKVPPSPVAQLPAIKVPDLTGKTRAEVERTLIASNLQLGEVIEEPRADAQVGTVVEQEPGAGTDIQPGGKVNLTVAAAVEPGQ
jgi:hypothetical protein